MKSATKQSLFYALGCFIIIALYASYYPLWLWDKTRTVSEPEITKHATAHSYVLISDNANMYCNRNIFNLCEQGCEIINSHWAGKRNNDGSLNCQLTLEMYFSSFAPETDSIVPSNRLILTLSNGDSIITQARKYHSPESIGSWRRRYACHAYRTSDYYPFRSKEIQLLRTYNIVGLFIESAHDTLYKSLQEEKSAAVRKRFVSMTNELLQND